MHTSFGVGFVDGIVCRSSIRECYEFGEFIATVKGILCGGNFANANDVLQLMRKLQFEICIVRFKDPILDADG